MNEDLYGLQASGIDPEIAAKMLGTKRKRKVTEAMVEQAMTPINPNRVAAGGLAVPISPWEGLAQVAKMYFGNRRLDEADKELAGLASENQKKVAEAMAGYEKTRMGDPGVQMPTAVDDEGNSNAPNEVAPVKADPRRAIAEAMASPLLQKNPIVNMDAKAYEKSQEPYTLTAGAQRFGPDNKPLAAANFKPERPRPPMSDFQIAQLKNMIAQGADIGLDVGPLQLELQNALSGREAIRGTQPAAPVVPQSAPAAPPPQSGLVPGAEMPPPSIVAAGESGKPFIATQAPGQPVQFGQPPVSNLPPRDLRTIAVDAAKIANDRKAKNDERGDKRGFAMEGLGSAIKEAESLLDKNPTASGLGAIVDTVAGFFGGAPRGADEAQALKVVGGVLTSKVPRFEGPQSDKDTLLYKETAGMVGDSTVPVSRRKEALKVVKGLLSKYENATIPPAGNEATGTITKQISNDAEYAALPSGAVFVGPDGKQRRKP